MRRLPVKGRRLVLNGIRLRPGGDFSLPVIVTEGYDGTSNVGPGALHKVSHLRSHAASSSASLRSRVAPSSIDLRSSLTVIIRLSSPGNVKAEGGGWRPNQGGGRHLLLAFLLL